MTANNLEAIAAAEMKARMENFKSAAVLSTTGFETFGSGYAVLGLVGVETVVAIASLCVLGQCSCAVYRVPSASWHVGDERGLSISS